MGKTLTERALAAKAAADAEAAAAHAIKYAEVRAANRSNFVRTLANAGINVTADDVQFASDDAYGWPVPHCLVDGLTFVRGPNGWAGLQVECAAGCGVKWPLGFSSLADLGRSLTQEPTACRDCLARERAIAKAESCDPTPATIDETLAAALRSFIEAELEWRLPS